MTDRQSGSSLLPCWRTNTYIPTARQIRDLMIAREKAWRMYRDASDALDAIVCTLDRAEDGSHIWAKAYRQFLAWRDKNPDEG
jgi:hypothetical protein